MANADHHLLLRQPGLYSSAKARLQFAVFIKTLFRLINPALRFRAKTIVLECTRRHRMRLDQTPLQDAVELRLRPLVGELYWSQATLQTQLYFRQKHAAAAALRAVQRSFAAV